MGRDSVMLRLVVVSLLLAADPALDPTPTSARAPAEAAFAQGDYETALRLWLEQAREGDAEAQLRVAGMYAQGLGVERYYAGARKWYRKAAEQGLAQAQLSLALSYASGRGGPRDEERAVHWFRQAARQGLGPAQASLGRRYAEGRGVEPNQVLAYAWLTLAMDRAVGAASGWREDVAKGMSGNEIVRARDLAAAWRPGEPITDPEGVVKPPVPIHRVGPVYPEQLRALRIEGVVVLQAHVDNEGRVQDVEVLRGLEPALDQAAIEALKQWRFEPGTRDGVPVDTTQRLGMRFPALIER